MRKLILGITMALAAVSAQAGEATARSYGLGSHGKFEMNMPASWQDEVAQKRDDYPPTITFSPTSGADFRVLVTPIWPARPDMKAPTPEVLKRIATMTAERIAPQSVEKKLTLKQLKGGANTGYYYTATDPAPKPGEYKLLNQGVISVGELVVRFTILTNDGQDDIVKRALEMLAAARH